MNDVLSTVVEITKLVKYSPKREQLLGTIQENFKLDDGDDEEKGCSLARLCVTRWTVKANAFLKIINNFSQLYELWDTCLNENLDRETRSCIQGCKSQMSEFKFFYGINIAYTVYLLTDNLSKVLTKRKHFSN